MALQWKFSSFAPSCGAHLEVWQSFMCWLVVGRLRGQSCNLGRCYFEGITLSKSQPWDKVWIGARFCVINGLQINHGLGLICGAWKEWVWGVWTDHGGGTKCLPSVGSFHTCMQSDPYNIYIYVYWLFLITVTSPNLGMIQLYGCAPFKAWGSPDVCALAWKVGAIWLRRILFCGP